MDRPIDLIRFTESGKQIVTSCGEKLRVITPKEHSIHKITGPAFHSEEITALETTGNLIYSGCLDGYLCISNIAKRGIVGKTDKLNGTIHSILPMNNYLLTGMS